MDEASKFPAHEAARAGHINVVESLLNVSIDPSIRKMATNVILARQTQNLDIRKTLTNVRSYTGPAHTIGSK